ncbi:MAG: glycosyltransferase family 2 protein [Pseudomonadales bacterium]|nr:glycosyltransferase family 2 protein [Pseudomonadales bacterium]
MSQQRPHQFSIIVTTKNRDQYLQQALDSILAQTRAAAEVVIVDDGSDVAVVDRLPGSERFQHVRHANSLGVSAARNAGARAARSDWLVFLDDDDWLADDFLEHITAFLEGACKPTAFIWSGKTKVFERKGKRVPVLLPAVPTDHPPSPQDWASLMDVTCSGMAFNREAFLAAGGFDEQLTMTEDRDLMFRLLAAGVVGFPCPSANLFFRIHDGSRLSNEGHRRVGAESDLTVLQRHQTFLDKHPVLAERFMGRVAKRLWDAGYYDEAIAINQRLCHITPGSQRGRRRQFLWALQRRFRPQIKQLSGFH